jgi:hypothetical protein
MRQVVSQKSDSSCEAKKTILGGKIKVCTRLFFYLFYSRHYNYRFTVKLGHAYVVCRDVHAKFLFRIFLHFQIYFLNKGSICTLDQICISHVWIVNKPYLTDSWAMTKRQLPKLVGITNAPLPTKISPSQIFGRTSLAISDTLSTVWPRRHHRPRSLPS